MQQPPHQIDAHGAEANASCDCGKRYMQCRAAAEPLVAARPFRDLGKMKKVEYTRAAVAGLGQSDVVRSLANLAKNEVVCPAR